MEPLAFILAATATRRHVLSAQPDAPIVLDEPRRDRVGPLRAEPVRRLTAALLRRLADTVEPHRAEPCQTATS